MRKFFMVLVTCWILFVNVFFCFADSFTSLPPEYQPLQMDSFLSSSPETTTDGKRFQENSAGNNSIPNASDLTVDAHVNPFLFPETAVDQSIQLSESVQSSMQNIAPLPENFYQPDTDQFLAYAKDLFDARFLFDIISPNITYDSEVLATSQIDNGNILEKILPIPEPSTFFLVLSGLFAYRQLIFRYRTKL